MKEHLIPFIKGLGIGAANIIPGVSGGTIALITGILEKLIESFKSFDMTALHLICKGQLREFAARTNLGFLIAVFAGIAVSILSTARLIGYLLNHYPVLIMAFFFGLILASIYFVGKTVGKWNASAMVNFIIGAAVAISLSLLRPAPENSSLYYLLICGAVATCSMILPGLSGSFVLLLMGNYQLVMIDAVNDLNFQILLPFGIGAIISLVLFSNLLSWAFRRYRDHTISILTGFVFGSLGTIWPWKAAIPATNSAGEIIKKNGETVIGRYQWQLPEAFSTEVLMAIILAIFGIVIIWVTETLAVKEKKLPYSRIHSDI